MSPYLRDLAERVAATFVQGALAVGGYEVIVTGDIDALRAAWVGGAAAVLSLVKGLAAKRLGHPETASLADGRVRH